MRDIPFVDAHVHLWDLARLRYGWLTPPFDDAGPNGIVAAIAATYLPADYHADTVGWRVAGYVHVDAGADPRDAQAETEWLSDLEKGPSGIVAFAALEAPDIEHRLAAQAAYGRVRGIRQIVNWHRDPRRTYTRHDMTDDPAWCRGFALLARFGLSFDLQAYPDQLFRLAAVIGRHPNIPVIINHIGMPVLGDPDARAHWSGGLRALARLPQVSIKLSGVGFMQRPWTIDSIRPWILEMIDIFGPARICAASDLPTDKLFGTVDDTLGAYSEIIAVLSDSERRAIWGENANRIYRLGLTLTTTQPA